MDKTNNKESLYAICSLIMIIVAVCLSIINKEANKSIDFIAFLLLVSGGIWCMWGRFFYNVKPLKLSFILTVIVIIIAILTMYVLKILQVDPKAPLAIIVSYATANYFNRNLDSIKKIFEKYIKDR